MHFNFLISEACQNLSFFFFFSGPTMKLRRPIVHKMYAKTIDAFYED